MKKYFCAIITLFLLAMPAAAADLFPVSDTQLDGETHWGYMDSAGNLQVSAFYAEAGTFDSCGLAVVKNTQGKTGLIDTSGKLVVPCRETPVAVEFSDDMAVFRYADKSVYFQLNGTEVGEYAGAAGFFSKEGLLRVEKSGKWGYVKADGSYVIAPVYVQAGDFSDGYALVRQADGSYGALTAKGNFTALPGKLKSFTVQAGRLAILQAADGEQLYSLSQRRVLTKTSYDSIGDFHDGFAIVQRGEVYGIVSVSGKESVAPQYYYLDYMGSDVYAIRDASGASMAIDSSGARVYAMDDYTGGFEPFRFGLSWHGTDDGGIVFFSDSGAYCGKVKSADTAEIVGYGVAKVMIGDKTEYVRVSDGKVLYQPERTYKLDNGVTISTTRYEKYLGGSAKMLAPAADDAEYGWDLQYPVISGMTDKKVQEKINTAIEGFFMNGPSDTAQRLPLSGGYGIGFCGRVLVVYANAVSGVGEGAMPWNDSIMLDLSTGQSYSVTGDLLKGGYAQTLAKLLPSKTPFYLYGAPRATSSGILYHVAHAQTAEQAAYTDSYMVYYSELADVLNTDSSCWKAIQDLPPVPQGAVYKDVPKGNWAYDYIAKVSQNGWMGGPQGYFYPTRSVSACQAVAALSRALSLSDGRMDGIDPSAWYAGAYGGAYEAGLLAGLEDMDPLAPLTRVQAMQLFANVLRRTDGSAALTDEQVQGALTGYSDVAKLSEKERAAAAYCISKGIISGTNGKLDPQGILTRAAFAKLLCAVVSD